MFLFSKSPDWFWGPPDSYLTCTGISCGGRGEGEAAEATRHLHLMSRLRMSGDMPVLPLYSYMHPDNLI